MIRATGEPVLLLVDDKPANLVALKAVLEPLGVPMLLAGSGEEALRFLLTEDVSCILLDVQMPGLDGFETARLVRERLRTRFVPILFLTAVSREEANIIRGYSAGAVDYIVKPFNPDIVLAKVRVFVDLARNGHTQRQEMAAALRCRDTFLSVASHELRTPLTSLALRLEQLRSQLQAPDRAEASLGAVDKLLDVIMEQTRRLRTLVDSVVEVERLDAGQLQLSYERLDLAVVVRDVAARFEKEAARSGAQLEISTVPCPGLWDRVRGEQVVTNLLANAIKYGAGGRIFVALENREGRVRLIVQDEGIGIAPDALDRIFDKFERAVSDRNFGGLGMGLFFSRQIVEALGGSISARPGLQQGAEFVVDLPVRAAV